MKIKVFILISILLLLSNYVSAQSKKKLSDFEIKLKYDFVSTSFTSLSSNSTLKLSSKPLSNNNVLFVTGYLLQGFKFSSPVDQFNATPPFDIRGYQPKDFSSYISYINDTRLLQQQITPIK